MNESNYWKWMIRIIDDEWWWLSMRFIEEQWLSTRFIVDEWFKLLMMNDDDYP
jgi:hypothetical protein